MSSLPPVAIVDARATDVAALVALDRRNFAASDQFNRPLWKRILDEQAGRGDMLTLVAWQDGRLVGAIVGRFRVSRGDLVVWSIAVDEHLRGTGLAQRLLAGLVGRTPLEYRSVSLDARRDNERARRFYARLGFQAVREILGGYADGTDAIRYVVELDRLKDALATVRDNR